MSINNRVNQTMTCAICFKVFEEYGHNAAPVAKGRVCNVCNDAVVIPARLKLAKEELENERSRQDRLRTAADIGSRR